MDGVFLTRQQGDRIVESMSRYYPHDQVGDLLREATRPENRWFWERYFEKTKKKEKVR